MKIYFGPPSELPVHVNAVPSHIQSFWPDKTILPYRLQAARLKTRDKDVWTSNPYLLDHFEPDEVMFYINGRWTPLVEASEATSLLKIFMPGEAAVELYDNGEDAKDMS